MTILKNIKDLSKLKDGVEFEVISCDLWQGGYIRATFENVKIKYVSYELATNIIKGFYIHKNNKFVGVVWDIESISMRLEK